VKQHLLEYLVCPTSGSQLRLEASRCDGDEIIKGLLISLEGRQYPVRNGIPRFVSSEEYTNTFGFQWNTHARIYFDDKDKYRLHSTYDQLQQKLGLCPENVRRKTVLDIGCGTGANAAATAEWGAHEVFCVDLSSAVEAAYSNTKQLDNVHVIQADLFKLPFNQASFDIIYSIGVLHHTPETAKPFFTGSLFEREWCYRNLGIPGLS